jgi:UDP-3-O-acyl N-acetylglucosamine deacetylase
MDGSARPFLDLLEECGVEDQDAPVRVVRISDTFSVQEGDSDYVAAPAAGLRLSTTIDFDHPLVGRQFHSFELEPDAYREQVSRARTFGFLREVEALKSRGLARGGSLDNAVVLTEQGLAEGTELRFDDEFVRHKTLDLIGDLALLGARLEGHIVSQRPSHRGNIALAREIQARADRKALARPILNIQQILQYLPHRYPFLLVDRVVEYEEGRRSCRAC